MGVFQGVSRGAILSRTLSQSGVRRAAAHSLWIGHCAPHVFRCLGALALLGAISASNALADLIPDVTLGNLLENADSYHLKQVAVTGEVFEVRYADRIIGGISYSTIRIKDEFAVIDVIGYTIPQIAPGAQVRIFGSYHAFRRVGDQKIPANYIDIRTGSVDILSGPPPAKPVGSSFWERIGVNTSTNLGLFVPVNPTSTIYSHIVDSFAVTGAVAATAVLVITVISKGRRKNIGVDTTQLQSPIARTENNGMIVKNVELFVRLSATKRLNPLIGDALFMGMTGTWPNRRVRIKGKANDRGLFPILIAGQTDVRFDFELDAKRHDFDQCDEKHLLLVDKLSGKKLFFSISSQSFLFMPRTEEGTLSGKETTSPEEETPRAARGDVNEDGVDSDSIRGHDTPAEEEDATK